MQWKHGSSSHTTISNLTYISSSIQWRCVVWQNAQLRVCACCVLWSKAAVASMEEPLSAVCQKPLSPSHIWFWISFGSLHFQTFLLLPILFAASPPPPFSCVTPYGVASLSLRSWGVDEEGDRLKKSGEFFSLALYIGNCLCAPIQLQVWRFPL